MLVLSRLRFFVLVFFDITSISYHLHDDVEYLVGLTLFFHCSIVQFSSEIVPQLSYCLISPPTRLDALGRLILAKQMKPDQRTN